MGMSVSKVSDVSHEASETREILSGGVELSDLRLLVVLAEELHFGRAAARLRLSQPGLSYRVQRLEEALGYQVVTRDRRGITLTPGGAALLHGAQRLLAEADRVIEDAARVAGGEAAALRVGVVGAALYNLVPQALRQLREDHPELRLVLTEAKTTAQVAALSAGTLDIGVLHLPLPAGVRLRTRMLLRDPVGVAVPAEWPLASKPTVKLADLADAPFVMFARELETATYDRHIAACVAAGFAPRVVQHATGIQTVLSLVAGGVGAAFIAASAAAGWARPGVTFLRIAGNGPELITGAAWRADAPPGVHLFMQALAPASP